jgi:glutamine amidotransferase
MIAIIDYGVSNLGSLVNAFNTLNIKSEIINDPNNLTKYDKIVLPGVGSFDYAMKKLHNYGWVNKLNDEILVKKKPVLGICLGMQLMCQSSDEGEQKGLGYFPLKVKKINVNGNLKIPHMGWNNVYENNNFISIPWKLENYRFYFVHSYCVPFTNEFTMFYTEYGEKFSSIIKKDNIIATQFHPEKSHKFGLQLLKNFGNK